MTATEVLIGEGLPDEILPTDTAATRVAVLTQPGSTRVATEVGERLENQGMSVEIVGLPDRDDAKSLEVVSSVYDVLAKFGLNRSDAVVGVGGGAVTDVAGFVAATWMRGVTSIYVPTTLVGAVDAAIGGKTGVNFAGKNLVGAFWMPLRVIVDLNVMRSLPGYLIREGLAEAYKTGLVGDPELASTIRSSGLSAPLGQVIEKSVAVKTRIVAEDPREAGSRAFLNFGHTLGHGIEFASTLSHGESVAVGMVAACEISAQHVGFGDASAVVSALLACDLPVAVEGIDRARVLDLVSSDKKRDSDGVRMVLLEEIGRPTLRHVETDDLVRGLAAVGI